MSVHDITTASYAGNWNNDPAQLSNMDVLRNRVVDCTLTYDGIVGFKSGDDYKIFTIPAGFTVTSFTAIILTVEGAADTIDFGDSSSATQFLSNLSTNVLGATASTGIPKHYPSADYVTVHADADITAAKFAACIRGYYGNLNA